MRIFGRRRPPRLELDEGALRGVPCWNGETDWVVRVQLAYLAHYGQLRDQLRGGVSKGAVVKVAAARAVHADHDTGRNCRPSVALLMRETQLSESTVQRASAFMRLVGLATEIMRGRHRTYEERMASWRCGDRSRGWASVYVLHLTSQLASMTPHPKGRPIGANSPEGINSTRSETGSRRSEKRRAPRDCQDKTRSRRRRKYPLPDPGGIKLASAWLGDGRTPPWAHRHSAAGWARLLAAPAAAGWRVDDLHQVLVDYQGVHGQWIAAAPRSPLKLMGGVLKWHGDLADRPAEAILAQEAELRAREAAHLAASLPQPKPSSTAAGRAAARALYAALRS